MRARFRLGCCLALLVSGAASAAPATTRYTLRLSAERTLHVEIKLPPGPPGPRSFIVPRAVPMGYGEQRYDDFIDDLRAAAPDGAALPVRRGEGPRWIVGQDCAVLAALRYRVDLDRQEREILAGGESSRMRPGYVGLSLFTVLGFLDGPDGIDQGRAPSAGGLDSPAELEVLGPPGWPLFSTLAPLLPAPTQRLLARASSFYELADAQVVGGPALALRALVVPDVAGRAVPLALASYAETPPGGFDEATYLALSANALAKVAAYFGTAPLTRYSVVVEHLRPRSPRHSYGMSLEHLHGVAVVLPADQALSPGASPVARERARYNLAHHMAHAWLPERCRGPGYAPFSFEVAPVLDSLFVSEGFAQYAAAQALYAADATALETLVERRFRRPVREAPAFLRRLGLVELSRVASTRYSQDFRTGRLVFARGALLAEALDREIRAQSSGTRSLREGLRGLLGACDRGGGVFQTEALPTHLAAGARIPEPPLQSVYQRGLLPLD